MTPLNVVVVCFVVSPCYIILPVYHVLTTIKTPPHFGIFTRIFCRPFSYYRHILAIVDTHKTRKIVIYRQLIRCDETSSSGCLNTYLWWRLAWPGQFGPVQGWPGNQHRPGIEATGKNTKPNSVCRYKHCGKNRSEYSATDDSCSRLKVTVTNYSAIKFPMCLGILFFSSLSRNKYTLSNIC